MRWGFPCKSAAGLPLQKLSGIGLASSPSPITIGCDKGVGSTKDWIALAVSGCQHESFNVEPITKIQLPLEALDLNKTVHASFQRSLQTRTANICIHNNYASSPCTGFIGIPGASFAQSNPQLLDLARPVHKMYLQVQIGAGPKHWGTNL